MTGGRRAAEYVLDMIEHAGLAQSFIRGLSAEEFAADLKSRHAVVNVLAIVGEAAAKLPRDFRDAHGDIPWAKIIGMRNVLAHDYLGTRANIVYDTCRPWSTSWNVCWPTPPNPSLPRRLGHQLHGVHPAGQFRGQQGIDHAVALDAGLADERGRHDLYEEMAFPLGIGASMADMAMGFIDHGEVDRGETLGELLLHGDADLHAFPFAEC